MLYIEDILIKLYHYISEQSWSPKRNQHGNALKITVPGDIKFISDVGYKVEIGNSISTSQANVVVIMIKRYKDILLAHGYSSLELESLINNPTYKKQPYQSVDLPREVKYAGNGVLVFRFKVNPILLDNIRKFKQGIMGDGYSLFNKDYRVWVVTVTDKTVHDVMKFIKDNKFVFDSDVEQFFLEVLNNLKSPPIITVDETSIKLKIYNNEMMSHWANNFLDKND